MVSPSPIWSARPFVQTQFPEDWSDRTQPYDSDHGSVPASP